MSDTWARKPWIYKEIAVSLMIGSLATTVLLESIDPRTALGDFLFWPQHYFHYFLKFGANNPIAPRIMFGVIVAVLSVLTLVAMNALNFGARISQGSTPALLAIALPMVDWVIVRRGNLGIEAPFGLFLGAAYVACVVYLTRGRLRFPLSTWLVLWAIWFCWWAYLFHSALDPISLIYPVFAFFAGVVWSLSLRPATRETA